MERPVIGFWTLESAVRTLSSGADRIAEMSEGGRVLCCVGWSQSFPLCPVLHDAHSGWQGHGRWASSEYQDKLSCGDPSSLVPSLPQEQGLKANSSKELSTCFTEVSGAGCAGAGAWPREAVSRRASDSGPSDPWRAGPAELLAHLGLMGTQTGDRCRGSSQSLGCGCSEQGPAKPS